MGDRVCILINGLQLIACKVPSGSEQNCKVDSEALENLHVMGDHGRFEISTMIYSTMDLAKSQTANIIAELVVDKDIIIYLGQIPAGTEPGYTVSRYLNHVPKHFELRVKRENWLYYPHPDEELLVGEVLALLSDPSLFPLHGSAPHTNLHNRIKESECYQRVIINHYGGRWISFLNNHPYAIYTHRDPKLEMRLVAVADKSIFVSADIDHEEANRVNEAEIVQKVFSILQGGEVEYSALLEKLTEVEGFTRGLAPSVTMLKRFLLSHDDIFWMRKDPEHTSRVGLLRFHADDEEHTARAADTDDE